MRGGITREVEAVVGEDAVAILGVEGGMIEIAVLVVAVVALAHHPDFATEEIVEVVAALEVVALETPMSHEETLPFVVAQEHAGMIDVDGLPQGRFPRHLPVLVHAPDPDLEAPLRDAPSLVR